MPPSDNTDTACSIAFKVVSGYILMSKIAFLSVTRHQFLRGQTYKNQRINVKSRRELPIKRIFSFRMASFYCFKYLRFLFCFLLLIFLRDSAFGRHIVGGEIFYECLGPGSAADTRNYRLT